MFSVMCLSLIHIFGKAPLTQYLGLPEELQRLEPSVTEIEHKEGYRYLLCSDGVTAVSYTHLNQRVVKRRGFKT